MRLTRRYRFSSSHRLHSVRLTDAENRAIYGKCNNPHGHGHDYHLEVSVRGPVDPETGRVADLRALDELIRQEVLRPFDHANLSTETPAFRAVVPTTENLAAEIRRRVMGRWQEFFPGGGPVCEKIRLHETRRNIFEVIVT